MQSMQLVQSVSPLGVDRKAGGSHLQRAAAGEARIRGRASALGQAFRGPGLPT